MLGAAALAFGVPSASAGVTCTYAAAGCQGDFQQLLVDAPPYDPTFEAVNGLVQGGDGASIQDFFAAMQDAGVAPDVNELTFLLGPEDLAVAEASVSLPVAVTLASGLVAYYVINALWSGQHDHVAGGAAAGVDVGTAVWSHATNVCGAGQGPGWAMHIDDHAPVWSDPAAASWINKFGTVWGYSSCGVIDPSTVPECENNTQSGGWPAACAIQQAVYNELGSLGCHGELGGSGNTGDGIAFWCFQLDSEVYGDAEAAVTSVVTQPGPQPGGAEIVAPAPAKIDFGAARSDVSTDTSLGSVVDTSLAVSSSDATWAYDGAAQVTLSSYTVPQQAVKARLLCTDDDSGVGWTDVTPGEQTQLVRSGIGMQDGAGAPFDCYAQWQDAGSDVTVDTAVQPNPVEFEFDTAQGTDTGTQQDGTTGSTAPCSSIDPGSVDLSPLRGIDLGNAFPFGVFSWVSNGVAGWEGGNGAPSFNIPLLGYGVGHPVHVDLSLLDPEMPTIRGIFLILFTVLGFYFLGRGALGFGGGGGGDE